jgi:hypothetical protein
MRRLRQDESACADDKVYDICDTCTRNIDMWDITEKQVFSSFKPKKNLKTKVVSCTGYINTKEK